MGESRLDGNECILVEKVLDPNIQSINQKMPEGWIDHDLINQLLTLRSTVGTSRMQKNAMLASLVHTTYIVVRTPSFTTVHINLS